MDKESIVEMLLDELELQCQTITTSFMSKNKRNSIVGEHLPGLLASTYPSAPSRRHASVDYSWLSPQNNLLEVKPDLYRLPDMIKMELTEMIRHVSSEDCGQIANQFRRLVRADVKATSPENIIVLFRQALAEHLDDKQTPRSGAPCGSSKKLGSFVRNNRVLPKYHPSDEQPSIAELTQISLAPQPSSDAPETKPRANTCI